MARPNPRASEGLWEASHWLLTTATPTFIFDAEGTLQHANIAADAFLEGIESEASIHHHLIGVFSASPSCLLCSALLRARSGLLPESGTIVLPGQPGVYTVVVSALLDSGNLCGIAVTLSLCEDNVHGRRRETLQVRTSEASPLTAREHEVLRCLLRGYSARKTATELGISHNTARNHVQTLLHKLDAHSKAEAVAAALRLGLLSLDDHL